MSITSSEMTPADIAAVTNGCNPNSNGWGGAWGEWIIVFLIFAIFGFGGRGNGLFGNGNNGSGGAVDGYVLASDFSNIERKIDSVNNGLCDGFYAQNTNMLTGFDRIVNNANQGFSGLNSALLTNGYETRNAVQGVGTQLASCCCDIREAISGVNYNMATQANAIQNQMSSCCCDTQRQIERGFCDTNYNMATQNNMQLQAIDKVGDRIIDYLANEKAQSLRDENQALRLAASQQAQNNYLVSQLRQPCPIPAYTVPNPNCCYNTGCSSCG